ncbi:MAG TPA: GDYXXLXY domain-containing protein [Spirochaetota bacterium]|nr:GDYXXLXY domain-containing protein [Spirochaetota bacterium]HOR44982.1 GDYXXLXY domain-containing protein [Spirochaetota bacterium]HPK56691.1 GDYXXLXY domain-containing protein [Spirochaetota bacterium]
MTKYKKILFFILVAAQLAVLGSMIFKQERLLSGGTKILLKCIPVDPRSLFSGDYVILRYEITNIDTEKLKVKTGTSFSMDQTIYVALEKDASAPYYNAAEVSSDIKTLSGRYPAVIRGKVEYAYDNSITIRYGVEDYFVPQNQGHYIESNMKSTTVEVSVDAKGNSAISQLFVNDSEVVFY